MISQLEQSPPQAEIETQHPVSQVGPSPASVGGLSRVGVALGWTFCVIVAIAAVCFIPTYYSYYLETTREFDLDARRVHSVDSIASLLKVMYGGSAVLYATPAPDVAAVGALNAVRQLCRAIQSFNAAVVPPSSTPVDGIAVGTTNFVACQVAQAGREYFGASFSPWVTYQGNSPDVVYSTAPVPDWISSTYQFHQGTSPVVQISNAFMYVVRSTARGPMTGLIGLTTVQSAMAGLTSRSALVRQTDGVIVLCSWSSADVGRSIGNATDAVVAKFSAELDLINAVRRVSTESQFLETIVVNLWLWGGKRVRTILTPVTLGPSRFVLVSFPPPALRDPQMTIVTIVVTGLMVVVPVILLIAAGCFSTCERDAVGALAEAVRGAPAPPPNPLDFPLSRPDTDASSNPPHRATIAAPKKQSMYDDLRTLCVAMMTPSTGSVTQEHVAPMTSPQLHQPPPMLEPPPQPLMSPTGRTANGAGLRKIQSFLSSIGEWSDVAESPPMDRRAMSISVGERRGSASMMGPHVLPRVVTLLSINMRSTKSALQAGLSVFLKRHTDVMSIIRTTAPKHRGTVESVVGDRVLIAFNATVDAATHIRNAAACASAIAKGAWERSFVLSMGLASGECLIGSLQTSASAKQQCVLGAVVLQSTLMERVCRSLQDDGVGDQPVFCVFPQKACEAEVSCEYYAFACDILRLGGGEPSMVSAVAFPRVADEDAEWLYQLESQHANDPFKDCNTRFAALLSSQQKPPAVVVSSDREPDDSLHAATSRSTVSKRGGSIRQLSWERMLRTQRHYADHRYTTVAERVSLANSLDAYVDNHPFFPSCALSAFGM